MNRILLEYSKTLNKVKNLLFLSTMKQKVLESFLVLKKRSIFYFWQKREKKVRKFCGTVFYVAANLLDFPEWREESRRAGPPYSFLVELARGGEGGPVTSTNHLMKKDVKGTVRPNWIYMRE
jgi:hypothetical protein